MSNKRLSKQELILVNLLDDVESDAVQKAIKGEKLKSAEVDEVRSYLGAIDEKEAADYLAEVEAEDAAEATGYTEEETQPKSTKSVIPTEIKKAYGPNANCGDPLAVLLERVNLEQCMRLAHNFNIPWNWGHLNRGMQRMNFGNVVRKFFNSEDGQDFAKKFAKEVNEICK